MFKTIIVAGAVAMICACGDNATLDKATDPVGNNPGTGEIDNPINSSDATPASSDAVPGSSGSVNPGSSGTVNPGSSANPDNPTSSNAVPGSSGSVVPGSSADVVPESSSSKRYGKTWLEYALLGCLQAALLLDCGKRE